jgi:ketosteroid isomerase-like protein
MMSAFHAPYHAAVLAKDADAILACMTDTIRMHSPTKMTPFEGKVIVRFLFGHLMEVLEDFQFTTIVEDNGTAVMFFTCTIGGRPAEGCDVLTFDGDGQIAEFKVLIRPLKALERLNEIMGERLKAFQ